MEVQSTPIDGLVLVRPRSFEDDRGSFSETWNQKAFDDVVGGHVQFVQANESRSMAGSLRGLHFQAPPHAQGKLVRVSRGSVLDVAVDVRKGSPTYGQHHAALLTEHNRWQFYVPPGFAHGFLALEDDTVFQYLCTALYNEETEGGLLWNDPDLGIDWGMDQPLVSPKDQKAGRFAAFDSPFMV
jgi:dTDP-4-dehydrorhamnose 3,5-epimerase